MKQEEKFQKERGTREWRSRKRRQGRDKRKGKNETILQGEVELKGGEWEKQGMKVSHVQAQTPYDECDRCVSQWFQ